MIMPGIEIIVEKLIKMSEYLQHLKELKPDTYTDYMSNFPTRLAMERLMQLIIDLALDINNVVLSYLKKPPAVDYFNSFIDLAENNVLDMDLAVKIAPSTGIRNRLIHEYEKINNKIVYESIEETLKMYHLYMKTINDFIKDK